MNTVLERRKKFLLLLPVLVLPFITGAFWALGGGRGTDAQKVRDKTSGLNFALPDANFKKEKEPDKLSFYEQLAADSAKLLEQIKKDPYFELIAEEKIDSLPEQKIYAQLARVNAALDETVPPKQSGATSKFIPAPSAQEKDIETLEQLLQARPAVPDELPVADSQLHQLNGMLDKILDIQHPERLRDVVKQRSLAHPERSYAVSVVTPIASVGLMDSVPAVAAGEHYFLGIEKGLDSGQSNAIEAVVHDAQVLVNQAVVKLRLLQPVFIKGHCIPKDHFIFGVATIQQERLTIHITTIRKDASLYPVNLEVYDLDGLPGIYIPGALTRDVAKQSTDQALQSVALNALNPSVGAQAAAAGIESAKSLLSKKVKLVRVQVKAGYQVLLNNKDAEN